MAHASDIRKLRKTRDFALKTAKEAAAVAANDEDPDKVYTAVAKLLGVAGTIGAKITEITSEKEPKGQQEPKAAGAPKAPEPQKQQATTASILQMSRRAPAAVK